MLIPLNGFGEEQPRTGRAGYAFRRARHREQLKIFAVQVPFRRRRTGESAAGGQLLIGNLFRRHLFQRIIQL